jgi:fatty acid desaturase/cytochrome b involved in lipid metabolism
MATIREDTQYRAITYSELKDHSTYSSAWISINGIVYDITAFIDRHPFGDTFRGNLGTECGGLFSSSHLNVNVEKLLTDERYLKNNDIIKLGWLYGFRYHMHKNNDDPFLDRIVYKVTDKDEFWEELKYNVKAYIRKNKETIHYTYREGILYILYYTSIYLFLSYLTWVVGSFIAALFLGFHMLCTVTNISHMASHFGFTRYKWLNLIAKYFFDLSGMSWLEWQVAHQTHHNQPHSSIDYQTNAYNYIGVRIHEYENHRTYHKYQFIYFWIVISFYLFFRLFMTTYWLFMNKEFVRHKHELITHVLIRVLFLAQIVYCAYLHGYLFAIILLALYSVAYSYSAFILLYNDHEETHQPLGGKEDVGPYHIQMSWAKTQVLTSNNWYPTNWVLSFIEFHYGYFNYHIEHHLFPAFKPSLCKKISPIVKSLCAKHNIPYISTTFVEVQKSLQKHLIRLSRAPSEEKTRSNT